LRLWAFGTSSDGLGLPELSFWLLTGPEFGALRREWERARGIQTLTKTEKANLDAGRRYILEAQMRAHNRKAEQDRLRAERRGMRVVPKIPEVANG
jgi:hypothetical protein